MRENRFNEKGILINEMLKTIQLSIDDNLIDKLSVYVELLEEGLKRQRLIGEKSVNDIINKQIFDSIYPLKVIEFAEQSDVLDLGSGGGLPGIPIKICNPGINMYLLEANKKKAAFLSQTIHRLKLSNTFVMHGRAERFGQDKKYRNKFDLVVCKAVAETAVLAELALPMTRMKGEVVLYKGPKGDNELIEATRAIEICGGRYRQAINYKLTTGEDRKLYIIEKVKESPGQYPRKEGKPEKRPLYN